MPKKTRRAPAKGKKKAPAGAVELPLSSQSSQSSTPPSPVKRPVTRASLSPPLPQPSLSSPNQHGTPKTIASLPTTESSRRGVKVAVLCFFVIFLTWLIYNYSGDGATHPRHPCACAAAASASNPLAKVLLSRRSGASGVHWHPSPGEADILGFASSCNDVSMTPLHGPFASVDQLRAEILKSFGRQRGRCVVWLTSPEAIQKVANALKEFLENNALGGTPVVPPQARGTLVVKSAHSREELKNVLPHRVVHMLTDVS
ncbi:hypothetical protein ABL78_6482 [Leptomonas seymouri]|uniref:Uncharacterized protein n=1 Tax=Leptomonas seymouri TaxID=5684 RepID=A0A0N1II61_LEPSE|nr:hypothetical protein ABL78_6482 [Leptomonas seymouri]|eukprot:KPI84453.1 hypothetical protein ABL78_6482 [Leptomonas seymouri]